MNSFNYQISPSKVGKLVFVERDNKLVACVFEKNWTTVSKKFPKLIKNETPILTQAIQQVHEYLNLKRKKFNIPIELMGTDFQISVWNSLLKIPFGKTISYKEQSLQLKKPLAIRAIASANGKNPIGIIFPCHRVIGSNGKLTGYAGGLDVKSYLLNLEK